MFFFSRTSVLAPGPSQPSAQWVQRAFSPLVKQLVCEAVHFCLSSVKIQNVKKFTFTLPCLVLCCNQNTFGFKLYTLTFLGYQFDLKYTVITLMSETRYVPFVEVMKTRCTYSSCTGTLCTMP